MVVCICGMHRSGTSMVSNTLSRCGIYLGPKDVLTRAGADNELGFWENDAFVEINDDLLRQVFGGWDSPPVWFDGWEHEPRLESLRDRARQLIEQHRDRPIWGWKDPRTSLTLPFWKQLLPDMKVVICLRNPLEVAQSLNHRNHLSIPFGLRLWYAYQTWALAATEPGARIITHYDAHFANPAEEIRRLLGFLSYHVSEEVLAEVAQTCAAGQRHNHARVDLLQAGVPNDVASTYYDMCRQAGPVWRRHFNAEFPLSPEDAETAAHGRIRTRGWSTPTDALSLVAEQTLSVRYLIRECLHQGDEARRVELQRLEAELAARRSETGQLSSDAAARSSEIRQLNDRIAERERAIGRLQGEASAYVAALDRLSALMAARDQEIIRLSELSTVRNLDVERLTRELAQRSDALSRLAGDLEARNADFDRLASERAAREEQLSRLCGELAADKLELQSLNERLSAREADLARLADNLASREHKCAELAGALADRDESLRTLSAQGERLRGEHQQLVHASSLRERSLQRRVHEISARDVQLRDLHSALAAHDSQVRQLQAELVDMQRRIDSGHGRAQALAAQVVQLQQQRHSLLQSRSWRAARPLRGLRRGLRSLRRGVRLLAYLGYWLVTGKLRQRLHQRREARLIARSGLFQTDWYRRQYADLPASADPLTHFVCFGAAEGRSPCPLFDAAWYLHTYHDVADSGQNPLVHFLRFGAGELRNPHPLFDTAWYLQQNPDVAAAGVNPLAHFAEWGGREGRSPHRLFDSGWYLQQNADVAAAELNPLAHFLATGVAEGRNPGPAFDVLWYSRQNPDVAAAGVNPLVHYCEAGMFEGRQPLPPLAPAAPPVERIVFPPIERPQVSLIVAAHNHWEHTRRCLQAIRDHAGDASYEVLLADDGSTDATASESRRVVGLTTVRSEPDGTVLGALRSANQAAAWAQGEYLVFLDGDTAPQPGWLAALLDVVERDPTVGMVGPLLLAADGRIAEAGRIVWNDGAVAKFGAGEPPDRPEYNYLRETDCLSRTALLVRTAVWDAAGGFDERFAPSGWEDADLALECRKQGCKVMYQPRARVVHLDVDHETEVPWNRERLAAINRSAFRQKWSAELDERHFPPNADPFLAHDHGRGLKRLLYCDWELPAEDRDSGSVRACNLMRVLASLGYRVAFLPANLHPDPTLLDRMQRMGIFAMCGSGFASLEAILQRWGAHFDTAIVSRVNVAEVCLDLVRKHCPQAFLAFDTTDLHFLREEREAEIHNDDALRAKALATKQKELGFMVQADITLVVSSTEVEVLRREAPRVRVGVVSNIHEIYGSAASFAQRKDLVFIGGFVHRPNVDAMKWMAAEIFPRIRRQLPGARLLVLGSNPPAEIRALDCDDFRVVGYVPDIAPYFQSCRLSVVPLRYGAGVKGKINMSMSYGLPVVGTSVGCEGMFLTHGRDAMIADDPQAFADAVCQAYNDEALWNRLSAAGLENVRQHFSFAAARSALQEILPAERPPNAAANPPALTVVAPDDGCRAHGAGAPHSFRDKANTPALRCRAG